MIKTRLALWIARFIFLIFLALLSNACGKNPAIEIPAEQQILIGVWQATRSEFENNVTSDNMLLVFHRDNSVSYVRCIDRVNGHNYTKMPNAKLISFNDRKFKIALDIFITDIDKTFNINKLPYQAENDWWITINGVSLRKLKRGEKSDYKNWQCNKDEKPKESTDIAF